MSSPKVKAEPRPAYPRRRRTRGLAPTRPSRRPAGAPGSAGSRGRRCRRSREAGLPRRRPATDPLRGQRTRSGGRSAGPCRCRGCPTGGTGPSPGAGDRPPRAASRPRAAGGPLERRRCRGAVGALREAAVRAAPAGGGLRMARAPPIYRPVPGEATGGGWAGISPLGCRPDRLPGGRNPSSIRPPYSCPARRGGETPGSATSAPAMAVGAPRRAAYYARAEPSAGPLLPDPGARARARRPAVYQSAWTTVPLCSVATVAFSLDATTAPRSCQFCTRPASAALQPAGDS